MKYYSEDGRFLLDLESPQAHFEDPMHVPTGLSGPTILNDNHNCAINFSPTINYHGASSSWTSPPGLPQQPKYFGTDG